MVKYKFVVMSIKHIALDQLAFERISFTKRPFKFALEVEAALVEWPLKSGLIPESCMVDFNQSEIVDVASPRVGALYSSKVLRNHLLSSNLSCVPAKCECNLLGRDHYLLRIRVSLRKGEIPLSSWFLTGYQE